MSHHQRYPRSIRGWRRELDNLHAGKENRLHFGGLLEIYLMSLNAESFTILAELQEATQVVEHIGKLLQQGHLRFRAETIRRSFLKKVSEDLELRRRGHQQDQASQTSQIDPRGRERCD